MWVVEAISKVTKFSIPIKRTPRGKRLPPWWTSELTISGREVNNYRKNNNYKTTDRAGYRVVRNIHLSFNGRNLQEAKILTPGDLSKND